MNAHSIDTTSLSRERDRLISKSLADVADVEFTEVPVSGPWRLVHSTPSHRVWKVPMPVRTRTLFFHRPPGDMALLYRKSESDTWDNASEIIHVDRPMIKTKRSSWAFSKNALFVRRPASLGPPKNWEYAMRDTSSIERERSLRGGNQSTEERLFRSIQIGDVSRHGLYLPAPSTVDFQITVPENGLFKGELILTPPEAADPVDKSNGAILEIEIISDANSETIANEEAILGEYKTLNINLSKYANKTITMRFQTKTKGHAKWDYVFIADPIVYRPQKKPKRVVMLFIDTLRQDAMSLYGYSRPTTPKLDEWSKSATVFENARSVAPWTLPSAQSVLTGVMPNRFPNKKTLPELFGEEGWATGFIAGNVYLSSTFGMEKGWGYHTCVNWPTADYQLKQARRFLRANSDRPALLMLHFMDMHLPYTEPSEYRNLFAGQRPPQLEKEDFLRRDVLKATTGKNAEAVKKHVRDRYDNNLRYLDDALSVFLNELDSEDIVVIFSDHGEEFWEHGGFEHGHTFYDELLKVPFIIKSPDLPPGRIDEKVSLLDLPPTLAYTFGLQFEESQGIALQEIKPDNSRALAFGSPLYGPEGWGAVFNQNKYISRAGKERVFNLKQDPEEQDNLAEEQMSLNAGRQALSDALGTKVVAGYRLAINQDFRNAPLSLNLKLKEGIEAAWQGADPKRKANLRVNTFGTVMNAAEEGAYNGASELFVIPHADPILALKELRLTLSLQGQEKTAMPMYEPGQAPSNLPTKGETLLQAFNGTRAIKLTHAILPFPLFESSINATNDEVREELKALGYMD